MKTFKFSNAIIYVEGAVNEERLREETAKFFRNLHRSKIHKKKGGDEL